MYRILLFCFICVKSLAVDPYPRNENIDIIHYTFNLEVNDTTNVLAGNCEVTLRTKSPTDRFQLNLVDKKSDGTGMQVFDVTQSGKPVRFIHKADLLEIILLMPSHANDTLTVLISYGGIPQDGFLTSKNRFGDRTFFADNWPDRGHHWLPTIDHPYDKATVDFIVTVPQPYRVVATGELVSENILANNRRTFHWRELSDVPVKVMAVGIARFSVQEVMVGKTPITTWVFPQNEKNGFLDFAVAQQVFRFMQEFIGTYPYEKLAHVQSSTRWGGLENASNIFYAERTVDGTKQHEGLIAHETSHQWFGDAVTEGDWYHVWLSEGFATYMAMLYLGSKYGDERLKSEMSDDRKAVIEDSKKNKRRVIDTTFADINKVLNPGTYQKAAWVLHMLRGRLGAETFQLGLRTFYDRFKGGNAMTADFVAVMEQASGQELDQFFNAWLYQPGHPRISGTWAFDKKSKMVRIELGVSGFKCPPGTQLEIEVESPTGVRTSAKYPIDVLPDQPITIPAGKRPSKVTLDPGVALLFEGEIKEKEGF